MVSEVGFGLIGCGNHGRLLGRCLAGIEGAKVVAVADINLAAAEKAKEETGAPKCYTDYHDLLRDGDVEAVVVAVFHTSLKEVSVEAAENGKHVFVEKPMGINSREGEEVVEACRKAGVKLMVGYCLRFDEAVRKMKSLVDEGVVGEMDLVTAVRETPPTRWAKWLLNPEMGGGMLLYLGSHLIDEVLWIVKSDVKRVYGEINFNPNLKIDETISFSMRFRNGVLANLGLSMLTIRRIHRVTVIGTEGTVISDPFEGILKIQSRKINEYAYPTLMNIGEKLSRTYILELKDFIKAIKEDTEPSITGEEGVKVLKIIDAVFKSNETGKPINLLSN